MKKVLLAIIFLAPFLTFADSSSSSSDTGQQPKFEARKQKIINRMQEIMSCVQKATTRDELKACKPNKKNHK